MKVVILQSNYVPWKGYFDLINDADIFVYYDEVQYTKNDWRNRNRIYTKNGLQWITIPIPADAVKKKISEVDIHDKSWQEQHHKTISMGYSKAPYFEQLKPILEDTYLHYQWNKLIDVDRYLIEKISRMIGIDTRFIDSKDLVLEGDRVERLIHLLKQLKADTYISGPAAKAYLEGSEKQFEEAGIDLKFKDYGGYPTYPQLKEPFENSASIIDLLANIEVNEIKNYIWGWRN